MKDIKDIPNMTDDQLMSEVTSTSMAIRGFECWTESEKEYAAATVDEILKRFASQRGSIKAMSRALNIY